MKVSQNWLKSLVEINTSPDDLSEKLSIGGFEVEELIDCSWNLFNVLTNFIKIVRNHSNAPMAYSIGFELLEGWAS